MINLLKLILPLLITNLVSINLKGQYAFNSLSTGFGSLSVKAIYVDTASNEIYAGGSFYSTGDGNPLYRIARWNGNSWDSLGPGVWNNGSVLSVVKFNGQIYIGGSCNNFGGMISKGVARWDGNNWNKVADFTYGNNSSVSRISVIDNELYVMGGFDFIDSIPAHGLAKFDGNSWFVFPQLFLPGTGQIWSIVKYNNELFVGGNFNGGFGKKAIAKFDGSNWVAVGSGFNGLNARIEDITIFQNKLFVAGYFQVVDGDPGNGIAYWDGSIWNQPGSGLTLPSNAWRLHEFQGELYAGGQFTNAGGVPVTNIAKWDGNNWNSLGSTFDNSVSAFDSYGNSLYIGGTFWTINGDTMNKITRYSSTVGFENMTGFNTPELLIIPNPSRGDFKIQIKFLQDQQGTIELFDILGKMIHTQSLLVGTSTHRINLEGRLTKGVYLCKVSTNGWSSCMKLLIE